MLKNISQRVTYHGKKNNTMHILTQIWKEKLRTRMSHELSKRLGSVGSNLNTPHLQVGEVSAIDPNFLEDPSTIALVSFST